MTLDDLERRNGRIVCVISSNSVALGPYYVKVVEDTRYIMRVKCSPKNLVFSDISFMAILRRGHPSESDKVRHSALVSENLTNNQP